MGIFFEVARISNIFFWLLDFLDFFSYFFFWGGGGGGGGVKGRCWARAYICRKIESTPLPGWSTFFFQGRGVHLLIPIETYIKLVIFQGVSRPLHPPPPPHTHSHTSGTSMSMNFEEYDMHRQLILNAFSSRFST